MWNHCQNISNGAKLAFVLICVLGSLVVLLVTFPGPLMSTDSRVASVPMYSGNIYVEVLRQRRINSFLINACLIGAISAVLGACIGVTGLRLKRQAAMVALSVAGETGRAMVLRPLSTGERPYINPKAQLTHE